MGLLAGYGCRSLGTLHAHKPRESGFWFTIVSFTSSDPHRVILFDILSGILSGVYSDILSGILLRNSFLSCFLAFYCEILADILSGILFGIYSDILFGILSGIRVQACPTASGAGDMVPGGHSTVQKEDGSDGRE